MDQECKHCAKIDTLTESGYCYECMLRITPQGGITTRGGSISGSQALLSDSQASETPSPCICGYGAMTVKALMQCTNCSRWWHPSCVGLSGLTKTHTKCMKDWKCPLCFAFTGALSLMIKEEINVFIEEKEESSDLQREVQKGVKAAIPDIINAIKATCSVEDVQSQQQDTWAQVAARKEIIREVVEETSKCALEKGLQLMDANLTEQKKRVRNAVISGVAEDYGGSGSTLKGIAVELLANECSPHELVTVKRLGEKKATSRRPILVVFKSEEAAQFYHNYGRGRNASDGIWINPDLTRTERNAMFEKRQARRAKVGTRPHVRSTARRPSEDAEAYARRDSIPVTQRITVSPQDRDTEPTESPVRSVDQHQDQHDHEEEDNHTEHTAQSNTS